MKTLMCTLFFCLMAPTAWTQTEAPILHRELVLRSSLQGDLSLVYKWETQPNRLWRLSGAFLRGNYAEVMGQRAQLNGGLGFSFGREIRLPLTDRLDFVHGPKLNLGLNWNGGGNLVQVTVFSAGLTYLLGALYHVNESMYVGFEGGPTLATSFFFQGNRMIQARAMTQFSTYQLQLTLGYRFPRFPPKKN